MGTGPIPSSTKALERAGWLAGAADLDLVEANEAFAAQACAVNKEMGWDTGEGERQRRGDRDRPPHRRLRCARVLTTLLLRDAEARGKEGVWRRSASAGGMGVAMCRGTLVSDRRGA